MSYVVLHFNFRTEDQTVIGNKQGKPFKTEKAAEKMANLYYDHPGSTKDDEFKVMMIQEGL